MDRIFPEMNAFNLTIDGVAGSKEGKFRLKYVMHSLGDQPGLQIITPPLTLGSFKYGEHLLTI